MCIRDSLRSLTDFPHRQFLRYSELVELSELPSLPNLVIVELPRLQKQCTSKYKAVEALVSSYDRTRINLCVIVQLPITSRKVPPSLTEPGTLKTSRHCYCRYVDSSCHAKLTLLAGGPLADKIVNRSCNINEHFHVEHDDQSYPQSYMRLVRACLVHWFRPHGQRTTQTTGIELSSSDGIAAASQYPPARTAQVDITKATQVDDGTS